MKIERSELVDLARSVYNGNVEIEKFLKKRLKEGTKAALFKRIEEKLWERIVQQHPLKNFAGERESRTRANILKRICTVIKSKFFHISWKRVIVCG